MVAHQYQPTTVATTDVLGNCTFTFPPPNAQNHAVQGTVSVNGGQAGTFTAFDSSGIRWGTWSGSQPYGPVTIQSNLTLTVEASGLSPLTQYQAQFLGVEDFVENLDASMPTALGASSLVGTDAIVNLVDAVLAAGGTFAPALEFYPCINFASLRLSATLTAGGPLTIECFWWNAEETAPMGYRRYIIGPTAQNLRVVIPHLGDQLQIVITNQNPAGGLPTLVDSSGEGNNGIYDPFGAGGITLGVPGLVAGDAAASVTNPPGGAIGFPPVTPGFLAGDFFISGWVDTDPVAPNLVLVEMLDATNTLVCAELTLAPTFVGARRRYGPGPTDMDTVTSDATVVAPGAHFVMVTYEAAADEFIFYLDGAPVGAPKNGTGNPATVDPAHALIGFSQGPDAATHDEIAYGPTLPDGATVAAVFAAATSFAGYTTAVLALGPTGYYHLDQIGATDATFSLCATHTSQPLAMFGGLDIDNAQGVVIDGGGQVIMLAPPFVFGGPAHIEFDPGGMNADYAAELQAQQSDGVWNTFLKRSNLDTGLRQDIDFFAPAQPLRLLVTNRTGAAHNADAALTVDLHRVG